MLAVLSTGPALVTGAGPGLTTAPFTPPERVLLVATVALNSPAATNAIAAMTDSTGLTWTVHGTRNSVDSGGQPGAAQIATAVAPSSVSMTVTATNSYSAGNNHVAMRVFLVSGQSGTPTAGVAEGSAVTNTLSAASGTPPAHGGLWFIATSEWNALGAPTSTNLTLSTYNITSQISGAFGYRYMGSAAVTGSIDAPGTGAAAWNWVGLHVLEQPQRAVRLGPNYRR